MSCAKNCILIFRNKKINEFEVANSVISEFENYGIWFDFISFVAYDSSDEIVRAVSAVKDNYENVILLCPREMESTLSKFVSNFYSAEFDDLGCLISGNSSVFIVFTNGQKMRSIEDISGAINKKYGKILEKSYVKTVGASPAEINEAIANAKDVCDSFDFSVKEKFGDCSIEMMYNPDTPKTVLDDVLRVVLKTLNGYVYALENVTLAERLVQLLKLRKMKICTAESFTGGGVGKRIVEISGASEVYFEGLNTYSNEAKAARLGVSESSLKRHGAVSEEVAFEMAAGLIKSGNCDVSVSTTGIAGPKSDNTKKPVGLLYIGVGVKDAGVSVYKYNLSGTRESITETAINLALFLAYKTVK